MLALYCKVWSKMNRRGSGQFVCAGSHVRQCSRPQWLVECEPTVWDITISEPVELVVLACGCAGVELRTSVEISRQLAPQVWVAVIWMNHYMAAAGSPECAKPLRNPCLSHKRLAQLIKTGSPPPNNPTVKHTMLTSGGLPPSVYHLHSQKDRYRTYYLQ